MITITAEHAAAMRPGGALKVSCHAQLFQAGEEVATAGIIDGNVKVSYTGSRTCTLKLVGWGPTGPITGIVPTDDWVGEDRFYGTGNYGDGAYGDERRREARGLLLPYVTKAIVWMTHTWPEDTLTFPLGYFTLGDPSFAASATGLEITVGGWDALQDLDQSAFADTYTIEEGTATDTAITDILTGRIPAGTVVDLPTAAETVAKQVFLPGSGKSPMQVIRSVAELEEWRIFIDRDGAIKGEVIPDAGGYPSAVWSLTGANSLITATLTPSAADFCNLVIVSGENSGEDPVYAVAENTDGPFGTAAIGTIAKTVKSTKATAVGQCQNIANVTLRKASRLSESISGTCGPIAHMDAGDAVTVASSLLELSDDPVYILEEFSVPLAPTGTYSFKAVRRIG